MTNVIDLRQKDSVKNTVGDKRWLEENTIRIRDALPTTWTHIHNAIVPMGFKLKLIGIDWRSDEDLALCMATFEKEKLLLRDGHLLRRT